VVDMAPPPPPPFVYEGCPNATMVVSSDGLFDLANFNATPSDYVGRQCAFLFQAPPGNVITFDWIEFNMNHCTEDYLILRDGLRAQIPQYGSKLCGAMPSKTQFTGNTVRVEVLTTQPTSNFKIWVAHNFNRLTFHMNPKHDHNHAAYALGSDIAIRWSLELHFPGSEDHGWFGLYNVGACESGIAANECWLATRSLPAHQTEGTVIFYNNEYKRAGWYDIRYFSGDASGTACAVPEEVSDVNQTLYQDESSQFQRCVMTAVASVSIEVTASVANFAPGRAEQLPGFELYQND